MNTTPTLLASIASWTELIEAGKEKKSRLWAPFGSSQPRWMGWGRVIFRGTNYRVLIDLGLAEGDEDRGWKKNSDVNEGREKKACLRIVS